MDRAFWGIGAGGVGQSLQTAHLEAILGNYHSCLDMNIYYSDEEMRKQAGNLVGKIVVTGQESAQGSSRGMREDVYKKHMSADKLPERLPYAIQTTLVELRGLKRFEFNTVPRLLACNESHAIVRPASAKLMLLTTKVCWRRGGHFQFHVQTSFGCALQSLVS